MDLLTGIALTIGSYIITAFFWTVITISTFVAVVVENQEKRANDEEENEEEEEDDEDEEDNIEDDNIEEDHEAYEAVDPVNVDSIIFQLS